METENNSSQAPVPRQPQPSTPPRPISRPIVDSFVARRPVATSGTAAPISRSTPTRIPVSSGPPSQTTQSAPTLTPQSPPTTDTQSQQTQVPRPFAARQAADSGFVPQPSADSTLATTSTLSTAPTTDLPPESTARPLKEPDRTGHAGLVGIVVFIVLGALLLSPFVPGKITQNFPLSSAGFSSGGQTLDCIGTQGTVSSSTKYNTKAGSPITYTYSSTTTQRATCNGQMQSAATGHNSQFNPLGLGIDVLVALAVSIGITWVWRFIFGEKRH